jgi:hypothetical protein
MITSFLQAIIDIILLILSLHMKEYLCLQLFFSSGAFVAQAFDIKKHNFDFVIPFE